MTAASTDKLRISLAFAAVTSLFFAWGFITSNNDPLIVALRTAFSLDYTEALLTQIVFFLAYGLVSLPAAWLSSRVGAVDMILGSLALMACGCILVVVSTSAADFRPPHNGAAPRRADFWRENRRPGKPAVPPLDEKRPPRPCGVQCPRRTCSDGRAA